MHAFALLGMAAAAMALPQTSNPAGCVSTDPSTFTITVVNATTASAKLAKRQDFQPSGTLTISLTNGVLLDKYGRTGYIASNHQFQFDKPAQPGFLSDSGYSLCQNNTIALAGTTIFYACKINEGSYNLYDESVNNLCGPVFLEAVPVGSSTGSGATSSGAGEMTDGQPTATSIATGVGEMTDGQPTATVIASGVGEKTDGQPTATVIASGIGEKTDGQPTATYIASGVGEKTDGQPTATYIASGVGEKTDGQPTATYIANNTVVPYTGAAARPTAAILALGGAIAAAML